VKAWSDARENERPYENSEQREWFIGACSELALDPEKTTLFEFLEADDRATFARK
jgi:hypothetical protein